MFCVGIKAQSYHSLSGFIHDEDGMPIAGATVVLKPSGEGTVSDSDGFYSIAALAGGSYAIEVSFLGFRSHRDTLIIQENTVYNITLNPIPVFLDIFEVSDNLIQRKSREAPLQLDIIDAAYLQQNLAGSFMKTLEKLPGLTQIEIGSGNSKPVIRGLGFNRVLVLENGIRHEGQQWGSDHGLEIDQHAVESVHITRGPASFLYGSDAIGGVVHIKQNYIPERNSIDGSLSFTGRTVNDLWGVSAAINGRKEDFYFKSRYTYNAYGDYRVPADSVNIYSYRWPLKNQRLRNTAGKEKAFHATAGMLKSNYSSRLIFSIVDNESGFFANARGLEPRNVDTTLHDKSHRDILLPSQKVRHLKLISQSVFNISLGTIEVDIGFQNNYREEYGAYTQHGYMPVKLPPPFSESPSMELMLDKNVFTGHLRYNINLGEKHEFTTGVSAEFQENKKGGWAFIIPDYRQQTASLFIYDKIQCNSNLQIHAGLRYDAGRLHTKSYSDWFETPVLDTEGDTIAFEYLTRAQARQRDFHNLSWALGASYNKGAISLKGHIGKSFRMPLANELSSNGVNYHNFRYEKGHASLSAETAYQLDLGFEYAVKQRSLRVSPFISYFPNYIYLTPSHRYDYLYGAGNQIFNYTQNQVWLAGGELFYTERITEKLTGALNAEYIYAYQMSGNKKGFSLPFTPPPSVLLSIDYHFNKVAFLTNSHMGINSRVTAPQERIVPPERKTEGYYIFNITAGTTVSFRKNTLNINFQINNLLNRKYMSHVNYYRLIGLPEAGRNFALHLQLPFKTNY